MTLHCHLQNPSVTALSILRPPHNIGVFTFCFCLSEKPHFIHGPRDAVVPWAWLCWTLAVDYPMCHLPKAFVYILWSIDTWRSAVHLAEVTRFLCVNFEGIANAWQGERFESLFPLKHSPANLCKSRVRSFHLCGRWWSGFYTDGVEPSPRL